MRQALFLLILILGLVILPASVMAADNSIVSLDVNYDGDKSLTVSYLCTDTSPISDLNIYDINGSAIQPSIALTGTNQCNTTLKTYKFQPTYLPPKRTIKVSIGISSPCSLCSRSSYVSINPSAKKESVPDASFIVILGVLAIALIIIRKKK